MKLVVDMNLSVAWIAGLQGQGVDAVHWSALGPQDGADDAIMAWARANDAIVLTRDLDFGAALTRQALIAPSVIQIRCGRVEIERHLPQVVRVIAEHQGPLGTGAIVTIEDDRVRVRVLGPDTSL
jgi:predicted nuclease of predicted toxin-antitoxin system